MTQETIEHLKLTLKFAIASRDEVMEERVRLALGEVERVVRAACPAEDVTACPTCDGWGMTPGTGPDADVMNDPCPACNAVSNGPVPAYCPEHDGDYSSFLAMHNCD